MSDWHPPIPANDSEDDDYLLPVTPAMEQAMAGNAKQCYLVGLNFKSGPVFLTDAPHTLDYAGVHWLANGWLIDISGLSNTTEMRAGELTIVLNNVVDDVKAYVLNNEHRNQEATIHRAMLDEDGKVIDAPIELWTGDMTQHAIASGNAGTGVGIKVSSPWSAFDKSNPRRTNVASQQRHHPDDYCLAFASHAKGEVDWGG